MKKLMTSIVFGFFATVVLAQTAVTFKDAKVETAYKDYIQLKNALVASKADEAKAAAGKLKTSLAS